MPGILAQHMLIVTALVAMAQQQYAGIERWTQLAVVETAGVEA